MKERKERKKERKTTIAHKKERKREIEIESERASEFAIVLSFFFFL